MLLVKRNTLLALVIMALSFGFQACTEDEAGIEETVEPAPSELPAEPPMNGLTGQETGEFVPQTVHFAFDRADLSAEAQNALSDMADYFKANANVMVQVEGHCDKRGTIEYNLALGARRAEAVKDYLVQLGVEANRMTTISYGEEKPVDEGHDETAHAKNRRAEFTISK